MTDEKSSRRTQAERTQTKLTRRNFLFAAGAGGAASAAAAAAVLASSAGVPLTPQAATAPGDETAPTLADSAHARNYYRTARI